MRSSALWLSSKENTVNAGSGLTCICFKKRRKYIHVGSDSTSLWSHAFETDTG